MLLDNFRLSYPEARVYWSWKDWLEVNPQEVKVGGMIGVVLAREEGSDPHDWISLLIPTPTHLLLPTGGHEICVWQRLCFCKLERSICVLWRANGGAVLEKNSMWFWVFMVSIIGWTTGSWCQRRIWNVHGQHASWLSASLDWVFLPFLWSTCRQHFINVHTCMYAPLNCQGVCALGGVAAAYMLWFNGI